MTIAQALDLALQHHQAGRLGEAEGIYRQILSNHPNHPDTLHLLGLVEYQRGRNDPAIDLIGRAVAGNPTAGHYLTNLGRVLGAAGRADEAIVALRQAVSLMPGDIEPLALLGAVLLSRGVNDEALTVLKQGVEVAPMRAEVWSNLGIALKQKGQIPQAIEALEKAVELRPVFPEALSNLGNAFRQVGRKDDAIIVYRRALVQKPDVPEIHNHLGQVLQEQEKFDEAIECFSRAATLRPSFAEAYNNLGMSLMTQGRFAESEQALRDSLRARPTYPSANYNLSLLTLMSGDLERGFIENEWRWKVKDLELVHQDFPQPFWNGEELNGRRLLLHSDQGFGDAIQFCRYAPLVAAKGARVILACQQPLARLMRSLKGVESLVTHGDPTPEFDLHCPLTSLPRAFKTRLDTIPHDVPYLAPDPKLVEQWQGRLKVCEGKRKVGLVWAGRPNPTPRRTIPLIDLVPLARVAGISLVSFQKKFGEEEAKNPPPGMNLVDFTGQIEDFADTAALLDQLDLVITIDTSIAHLAGALGKPTWLMLPFVPDWRWLLHRTDSPWYPTMRLFRQSRLHDWPTVIADVARELELFANESR